MEPKPAWWRYRRMTYVENVIGAALVLPFILMPLVVVFLLIVAYRIWGLP